MTHHLAQANVARARASLDSPLMREFVDQIAGLNALAERSPGFVWRLQADDGDATSIRIYDDPLIVVNVSVWESVDALKAYAYRSAHAAAFRRRHDWFEELPGASLALWWIPAGLVPDGPEARRRLEMLGRLGPTADAFTFRSLFPPPGSPRPEPALR